MYCVSAVYVGMTNFCVEVGGSFEDVGDPLPGFEVLLELGEDPLGLLLLRGFQLAAMACSVKTDLFTGASVEGLDDLIEQATVDQLCRRANKL